MSILEQKLVGQGWAGVLPASGNPLGPHTESRSHEGFPGCPLSCNVSFFSHQHNQKCDEVQVPKPIPGTTFFTVPQDLVGALISIVLDWIYVTEKRKVLCQSI